jgi:hypothetical protein
VAAAARPARRPQRQHRGYVTQLTGLPLPND